MGVFSLLLGLLARFTPAINDRLSGKPEPMRWIADSLARSVASKMGDDFPVIAVKDEKNDCPEPNNTGAFSQDDLFYVFA